MTRRVTIRRDGPVAWPWVVTIDRRHLPPISTTYGTYDVAVDEVRALLALWRRAGGRS